MTAVNVNSIIQLMKKPTYKAQQAAVNQLCSKVFIDDVQVADETIKKLMLPMMKMLMKSHNVEMKKEAIYFIHKMSEETRNAKAFIEKGVLPQLFQILTSSDVPLLVQALQCLSYYAADFPQCVIEATPQSILSIVSFLSNEEDVVHQAVVCLGNLCASTFERKQMVIDAGVPRYLKPLLNSALSIETMEVIYILFDNIGNGNEGQKQVLFDYQAVETAVQHMNSSNPELAKCATLAIGTLANGGTVEQKQRIIDLQVLPILVKMLTSDDENVAEFAACGLKSISESNEDVDIPEQIQAIIAAGAIPHLTMLLKSRNTRIINEALGVFINITACDSRRCQDVLDAGVLPLAKNLLKHGELSGKILVMALMENMTSYNANQVNMIIEAKIVPDVLTFFGENNTDFELPKKSMVMMRNVISFVPAFANELVNMNVVSLLCFLLQNKNVEIINNSLTSLKNILENIDADELRRKIDECNGYEKIQYLRNRGHGNIKRLADTLLTSLDSHRLHTPDLTNVEDKPPSESQNDLSALRKLFFDHWEFGHSETGEAGKRVIVFEMNNASFVREYHNEEGNIYCYGCFELDHQKKCLAEKKDGIFYVPFSEKHSCQPRSISEVRLEQSTYREKSLKRHRIYESLVSHATPTIGKRAKHTPSNSFPENSETSPSSDRHMDIDYIFSDPSSVSLTPASSSIIFPSFSGTLHDSVLAASPTSHIAIKSPTVMMGNKVSQNPTQFGIEYWLPPQPFVKDCCGKFGIQFHRDNYKEFWFQVDIGEIHAASIPDRLHPMKNTCGFACFSVFFTCSEESAGIIEKKINQYFFNNSHLLGQYKGYDFTTEQLKGQIIFANNITDCHLELICRWLKCKIMVHENGNWEQYGMGSGQTFEDCPLFIIEKKNDKFYPVLSLKN